jgi:CTD small phosphatase-like protein 2
MTSDGVYVKDLRVINRDISEMVLVDNAAYSYAYQLDNAIPIIPYYKGKNDF